MIGVYLVYCFKTIVKSQLFRVNSINVLYPFLGLHHTLICLLDVLLGVVYVLDLVTDGYTNLSVKFGLALLVVTKDGLEFLRVQVALIRENAVNDALGTGLDLLHAAEVEEHGDGI